MGLKETLHRELTSALREGNHIKASTLRLLLASVINKEKEKRHRISQEKPDASSEVLEKESELSEEEFQHVVSSEVKRRKEAIEGFEKGKRPEMAEKERKEMEILMRYLPEQLSEDEIWRLAKEAAEKIGAKGPQDIGRVMGELMPKIKGKADGALVSKIVKEILR